MFNSLPFVVFVSIINVYQTEAKEVNMSTITQRIKTIIQQIEDALFADRTSYDLKQNDALASGHDSVINLIYFSNSRRTDVFSVLLSTHDENRKRLAIENQTVVFTLTTIINGNKELFKESKPFDTTNAKNALKAFRDGIKHKNEIKEVFQSSFENLELNINEVALTQYNNEIEKTSAPVVDAKNNFYNSCDLLNAARKNLSNDIAECSELAEFKRIEELLNTARNNYLNKVSQLEETHDIKNLRCQYNQSKSNWHTTIDSFSKNSLKLLGKLKLALNIHSKNRELVEIDESRIKIK